MRIWPHQCPLPGERVPEFSRAGVGKRCDFTMNHPTSVSYADSFYPSRGEAIKHPFGVPFDQLYPHQSRLPFRPREFRIAFHSQANEERSLHCSSSSSQIRFALFAMSLWEVGRGTRLGGVDLSELRTCRQTQGLSSQTTHPARFVRPSTIRWDEHPQILRSYPLFSTIIMYNPSNLRNWQHYVEM